VIRRMVLTRPLGSRTRALSLRTVRVSGKLAHSASVHPAAGLAVWSRCKAGRGGPRRGPAEVLWPVGMEAKDRVDGSVPQAREVAVGVEQAIPQGNVSGPQGRPELANKAPSLVR